MDKQKVLEHFETFDRNLAYREENLNLEIKLAEAKLSECRRARSEFHSFKDFITKALG